MTGDEDRKQLELELLAADVRLRRKQEFWETPRNVAILVGATAAIAAAIGYWLGRGAAPPPPTATPARTIGDYDPMSVGQFMDVMQTAGTIVVALMLVYVVVRLDRTLTAVAEKIQGALGDTIKTQNQLLQNVRRIWERIDLIESREGKGAQQSGHGALGDVIARAWERILKVEARLDAIEKGEPPPAGARPTDPPFGSDGSAKDD